MRPDIFLSFLLKYDLNGTLFWSREWSLRKSRLITTDGSFLYLSGIQGFPHRPWTYTYGYYDSMFITKCTIEGQELWTQFYWSEQPNYALITVIFGVIGVIFTLLFYKERKK